jgi:hypothetical protein
MATVSLPLPRGNSAARNGHIRLLSRRPAATDIARYLKLEKQRLELNRKARAIQVEADLLAEDFEAFIRLETKGRKVKSVSVCGHILSLVAGRVCPAWKTEFIDRLGESVAQEVIENTKTPLVLSVELA